MPQEKTASLSSEATPAPQATHDVAVPSVDAPATSAFSDAGDAHAAAVAALANNLTYTLTVGQARATFAERARKIPAERTLQNYCTEGVIAAQKIRTIYGAEWLINEGSLLKFIERQPIVTAATPAPQATHNVAVPSVDAPATSAFSDAGDADAAPMRASVGDRRTLAELLIENAKLLATMEGKEQVIRGKDETITELKDDRSFLRDEVREARQQRTDVKEIASRMLEAMQTIAIAGKLPPAKPQADNLTARVISPDPGHDASRPA
jgi:hypothetical protein